MFLLSGLEVSVEGEDALVVAAVVAAGGGDVVFYLYLSM